MSDTYAELVATMEAFGGAQALLGSSKCIH